MPQSFCDRWTPVCRAASLALPVLHARMAVGLGQALVFHHLCLAATLCLPDAVPDINRSWVKDVRGEDVEIKLVAYAWPSAEFVTALSKMMIQEVSWYSMVMHGTAFCFLMFLIDALTVEMGCPWPQGDLQSMVQGFGIQSQHQRSPWGPEPRCGPVLDRLQRLGMFAADRLSESCGPGELARGLW